MSFLQVYGVVAGGIGLSFILPVIRKALDAYFPKIANKSNSLPDVFRKFGLLAIFSLLTALLILAFIPGTSEMDWRAALLAGYAWDSTLQKFVK